ncbi:MAG TPA: hypothetical protein GXZ98_10910, partial [Firmicutes bacterium]|nr:hypothetical protein [Bacillota bacterium]
RARLSALTATPAQSVPTKEVGTAPAGDKDGGAQGETWVRPHLLPPFLAALRELTATLEAMLALYRQGTNALSDWDQLGQSLAKATELNAALRRQALQLHLVPVSLLIQRLAAESGLPGEIENDNGFEAELTGETAAKLVPPLAALIKGLGWTQAGQPDPLDAVKTPKPFLVRAERVGEFLTLKVKRGNAPGSGANRENQLVPDELSPIEAAIAEVQGRLKLDPTGGWFCLTVPVLPATIRSVIFQIGKEEYALPARNYLYHLTIKQQEVWESGGFTFLYRYPQVIPLLFTPNLSPSLDREEQDLTLALIEVGRIRFGLPVTKVEGYQELLRTDSDRPVVKGPFSFAKTYRPNGRLVLLADPNELAGLIPEY